MLAPMLGPCWPEQAASRGASRGASTPRAGAGGGDVLVALALDTAGAPPRAGASCLSCCPSCGPTSALFLEHGRYLLASQPESLIIFERLSDVRARFDLHVAWKRSKLPDSMLTDMAQIWGVAL